MGGSFRYELHANRCGTAGPLVYITGFIQYNHHSYSISMTQEGFATYLRAG